MVAGRIVADISERGWPEGAVLGSEVDLVDRYGVSRAVFREAVRLLEHQEVAFMRRGPGGGLVVTLPTVDSVIDAVMVYLHYIGARLDEVVETRLTLEQSAARLASDRLSEADFVGLRHLADREAAGEVTDHRELHAVVAAATHNPALEFFVDLLSRVVRLYSPEPAAITAPVLQASAEAHTKIVESVLSGDGSRAGYRMRRHLEAEAAFMATRLPGRLRSDAVFSPTGSTKRGESVARQIFTEVAQAGWKVGEPLGSETELIERFGISRAVLREAVRMLEHHQIARMRRGPGGGLFVAEPGIDAATAAVALRLSRPGIEAAHLFEVRGILEVTVLDRVIERLDDTAVEALKTALDVERETPPAQFAVVGHDLHAVLATLSGNRVLELLTHVLVELSRNRGRSGVGPSSRSLPTEEVTHAHQAIVEAIVAGDLGLARHRMRRHLGAVVDWIR